MDSPLRLSVTLAADVGDPPLTRVSLAYVEHRINLYLRFGQPLRELRLDRWRRCASFAPGAVFCRVRWESNDYGTTRWQVIVLQARTPGERMQRIAGVRPGAQLLLCAEGEASVQAVLQQIDAIEALAIDPTQAAPAYWLTLGNRLAAHKPLPAYGAERHAAWLRGEDLR
ncbi:DUF2840 domain-containing protein [Variovorax sp. LT1R16]|uniref:DUF2840 domain-containing protein n=1 Tax=Variovorax sp. LT1R16 TaxID=3443728 RepID=UPI003F4680FA